MASFARGDDSTSSGEDEGNANQKFDGVPLSFGSTRITQCGVLPLQCAGVEVSNKLNATCTVVKVKAHDRARLLFDLATFFQRNKHNVVEADVTTSPNDQMASDIFLIQFEGGKITKPRRLAEDIRDVVLNVEEELFENDGVSPKPSPAKPARRSAGTRRDGGDDETDSDFKETESELDLETESQSDSAKPAVRAREGAEKSGQGYQVDLNSRRGGSGGLLSLAGATDKDYSRADAVSKDDKLVDPFARGDGLKLSNVLHAGSDFTNATEISMEVRDRVGLLADVCHCLVRNNVSVLNAHIYTTSDGLASNYFSVRDARTNGRVADAVLEEMRQALAAQCHYVRRQTSGDTGGLRLVHEETAIGQLDSVFGTLDGPTPGDSPTSSLDRRSGATGGGGRRFEKSIDGDPQRDGRDGRHTNPENFVSGGTATKQHVSKYGMDNTRSAPGAGMTRAHGGEVLEHAWTHTQKLLSAKGFLKYADLSLLPAVDLALVDDATRHVVEVALNALPAYKSLTFPSAKSEIFHEFREVRWEPGELAFAEGSPVPNLYVILEGALHREGYVDGKGRHVPGNVLSRGALYGEAALAHAYQTPARVVSENGELEGVATRAFAVSCETFKRIVRARVHRARRLLANVLNVVETFRPAPAESKELLLNALWSGSAARRKGEAFAGLAFETGKGKAQVPYTLDQHTAHTRMPTIQSFPKNSAPPRAMHVVLEGEVRRVCIDGTETVLKAGESFGEDWLLSDTLRAEIGLDENVAGRALRREASTTYVASSVYQPVTLEITRGTLRNLWGPDFDKYLRSRHDRSFGEMEPPTRLSSDSRRASLPDMNDTAPSPGSSGKTQVPPSMVPVTPRPIASMGKQSETVIITPGSQTCVSPLPPSVAKKSWLKKLSKTFKRAVGIPSKQQKAETGIITNARRATTFESATANSGSVPGAAPTQTVLAATDDLLGALPFSVGTFGSHDKSGSSVSSPMGTKMSRIGTMLDIRDARECPSDSPVTSGKLTNPVSSVGTTFSAPLGGAPPVGGSKKSNPMRNAHSVMDICTMVRDVDVGSSGSSSECDSSIPEDSQPFRESSQSQASDGTAMELASVYGADADTVTGKTPPEGASVFPLKSSPLDNYVFCKQLGVGLTGSVYKAWRRVDVVADTNGDIRTHVAAEVKYVPVAVKVMDKVKILDINETAHVVRESKIMKSVAKHPFIVSMVESFQTKNAMFIVMEYAAAKDLFHMIHEYGALRVGQTKAFVVQTVLALDHVHAKGYVYRDLKPENLLVREDGYLRLTDFGFAKALRPGERAYTVCGTPDYLAPETLRQQGCTRAADFWAVGVLLFEMLTGYPPFHGQTHSELYRRITSGRMRAFPRNFDEDAADLVDKLLKQSEGERIGVGADGIQRIRRHAFFKNFSWTAVLEQRAVMLKPDVKPDLDKGPGDVKHPVGPDCLKKPCGLTDEEQKLFADF